MGRLTVSAIVILLMCLPQLAQAAGGCKLDVGGTAPDLGGMDVNGRVVDLEDYRGKWVFVDFWASWCGPCMRELPDVVELSKDMSSRDDFAVLSVSLDGDSTLKALMNEIDRHSIDYPVVYDDMQGNDRNADAWCIETIPATFLIAPDGTLVDDDVSPHDVRTLLAQQGAPMREQPELRPQGDPHGTVPVVKHTSTARIAPAAVLLEDSPSTGQRMYRDLEVMVPIFEGQPETSNYQLIVATVEQGPDNRPIQRGAKYNLDIRANPGDPTRPYLVQIQNTTDPKLKEKGELGSLPNMSFFIDQREGQYKFIVPVPGDSIKYAYKVSLLNEGFTNYIDSSTFIVDVAQ